MKVSIKWLKNYVPIEIPYKEVAEKLTLAGAESKITYGIGEDWGDKLLTGEIAEVNAHPNADRLRLATVNLGEEKITVVCGAPNLNVGDKIAFAREGAKLINGYTGEEMVLTPAKIRGVESSGMICSEKELGISDNHEEIIVLPKETQIGKPLSEVMGEPILELDITPNRVDLLSVIGIAREAAVHTGKELKMPEVKYEETKETSESKIKVQVKDAALCPRYSAAFISDVKVGQSPEWMQECLKSAGMRPINSIVDITNYVMLEYGQPLHAFDYDKIKEGKIIVKRAEEGESFTTLDGVKRPLDSEMLVIADAESTVAIAGVMGGENSEVSENTKNILLESANFKASNIHYTARKLGLMSEASMRFERNLNPRLAEHALKRAVQLLVEHCGGKAAQGFVDEFPTKKENLSITFSVKGTKQLLGDEKLDTNKIGRMLRSLGFGYLVFSEEEFMDYGGGSPDSGEEVWVDAPYWRSDVKEEVDIVEEIARVIGYDNLGTTMLSQSLPKYDTNPIIPFKRKVRDILVGFGFQEIVSNPLTSSEALNKVKVKKADIEKTLLRVVNPMSKEQEFLRTNMRADLLTALTSNRRHEEGSIKLFEIGRIYIPREGNVPLEPEMLYGLIAGPLGAKEWSVKEKGYDFYDVKGVVEHLMDMCGISATYEVSEDEGLKPGYQANVLVDGKKVGVIGELHPTVAKNWEITEPVFMIGLSMAALLLHASSGKLYDPIPKYPAVLRDLAIVLDKGITHQKVEDTLSSFPLVRDVSLFDVYEGKQVAEGKRSLAYRLTFQSDEHTLTDEEVDKVQTDMVSKLNEEFGAELRS